MEMIAMLNGMPSDLEKYLAREAKSVIRSDDYNANLAGLGAFMRGPYSSDPTLPMRGGWQRGGLQRGLSRTAAATFAGSPTSAMTVADQVRRSSIASQIYSNRMAGIPESVADAVKAAQAGQIASQQYNPNIAGIGQVNAQGNSSAPVTAETVQDNAVAISADVAAAVIDAANKAAQQTLEAAKKASRGMPPAGWAIIGVIGGYYLAKAMR